MQYRSRRKEQGFSLLELLVVIAILALLAGVVGPALWKQLGGAKTSTAAQQIKQLGGSLDNYRLDNGKYPTTQEGLQALVAKPNGAKNWNGPYIQEGKGVPKDPWNNDYHYESPGKHPGGYDLYSLGQDNKEGGEGEDKDVHSWDPS